MFKLYVGYIASVEKSKSAGEKITTYTIEMAQDSIDGPRNKVFRNIYHSYSGDPDSADGILREGTKVIFIADKAGYGFIIATADKNPGIRQVIPMKDLAGGTGIGISTDFLDNIDNGSGIVVSEADWIQKKMDGWIGILYSGLVWLRSKPGLEFIMNPVLDLVRIVAKKFTIKVGPEGLEHGSLSFDFDKRQGKANFSVLMASDTTGLDPTGTISMFKMGQHTDPLKKVSFFLAKNIVGPPEANKILDINAYVDGTVTIDCQNKILNLKIDPVGNVTLNATSLCININELGKLKINSDGTSELKTSNLNLGDGVINQSFMRGDSFKENYDDLLDLLKNHTHGSLNAPSIDLQIPLPLKKLQKGKELSSKHNLD